MCDLPALFQNINLIHNKAVTAYMVLGEAMGENKDKILKAADKDVEPIARLFMSLKGVENSCLSIKHYVKTVQRIANETVDNSTEELSSNDEETPYIQELMLGTHGVTNAIQVLQDALKYIKITGRMGKQLIAPSYRECKELRKFRNEIMAHPFTGNHRILDVDGNEQLCCATEINKFNINTDTLELTVTISSIHKNGKISYQRHFKIIELISNQIHNIANSFILDLRHDAEEVSIQLGE